MIAALAMLALALTAGDEVARVGATPITRTAFALRAEVLGAGGRKPAPSVVLDSLVDEVVLANEGRRLGLASDPTVVAQFASARRRALVNGLLREIAATVKPTDDELRAAYHATTDFVRAHVFRYATESAAKAGAGRLASGGTTAAEAKLAQSAQAAARDVEVGFLMRAQVDPALQPALFQARAGAVTAPVKVGDDWVVAKVVEIIVGDETGYARALPALRSRAHARAADEARQHLVAMLSARTKAQVDEDLLSRMDPSSASPADLQRSVARAGDEAVTLADVQAALRGVGPPGSQHGTQPSARISVAHKLVEERLLAAAARERGLDKDPDVLTEVALMERGAVASAAVDALWKATKGDDAARVQKVRARVRELRANTTVNVDEAVLAQVSSFLR